MQRPGAAMSSSFDLDAYIANYTGYTRLKRLSFIAQKDEALKREALRIAVDEVKRTSNTTLYNELVNIDSAAITMIP